MLSLILHTQKEGAEISVWTSQRWYLKEIICRSKHWVQDFWSNLKWNNYRRRSGAGANFLLLSTPLQNNTWQKHLKGFLIVTTQAKTKGNRVNVGVKYAEKQQRKFLPEKLKEGRNIIGLQVCGFSQSNCFPKIQIFCIIVCSKQFRIPCYTSKISFCANVYCGQIHNYHGTSTWVLSSFCQNVLKQLEMDLQRFSP